MEMGTEGIGQLGRLLRARREERGLSTHRLAAEANMDQATIVRLEAGTFGAPRPDKLTRIAQALGLNGADVFALAGYTVPGDLPTLRPYLQTKYGGLLLEDIDKIEAYVARLAKKRGVRLDPEAEEGALAPAREERR